MNKDIKLLKEWVETDRAIRNNETESDFDKFCEERNIAIENVLKEFKKLEKEKAELKRMLRHRIKYSQELEEDLFEGCSNYVVPKSVIREKIEELEHEKSKRTQLGVFILKNYDNQRLLAQIQVLKELLGEE